MIFLEDYTIFFDLKQIKKRHYRPKKQKPEVFPSGFLFLHCSPPRSLAREQPN
jgi:hypothetical protein